MLRSASLNSLKPTAVNEELEFVQLLLDSFREDPKERPYARDLAKRIQAICKQRPYKYVGECCILDAAVSDSSTLKHAVDPTQSTLSNPEDLEKGSLLHFVANTAHFLGKNATLGTDPSLRTLYRQVSNKEICSIRSAERKFLLIIAPVGLPSIPVHHHY